MKKLLQIVLVALLILPFCAQAQNSNYNALNGPFGGTVNDVIADNSGNLVAATVGGIFRSTDAGATWVASNSGITDANPIIDLEKDAASGKLYGVTYYGFYTSTDGGVNWVSTATNQFSGATFTKKGTTSLYVVTNSGQVWLSSNEGVTWANTSNIGFGPSDVEITSSNILLVSVNGKGIYKANSASALAFTLTSISDVTVQSLTISGSTLYALASTAPFKSIDGGATWTTIKGNNPDSFYNGQLTADPAGVIYNFKTDATFRKTSDGVTWTSGVVNSLPSGAYNNVVSSYFSSPSVFFVGYLGLGLQKTSNTGAAWASSNNGLTAMRSQDLIYTPNGRLIYTSGDAYGLYVSVDDGTTWDFSNTGATLRTISGFAQATGVIYAYSYDYTNGLIKSVDNGSTWTTVSTVKALNTLSVSSDGTKLYGFSYFNGTTNGFYLAKSTDSGVTWSSPTVSGLPTNYSVTKSKLDAAGNLFWYIFDFTNNSTKLYKINTTNATATVVATPGNTYINDIDYFNGKLYCLTNGQLQVSTDAGTTWTAKTIPSGAFSGTVNIISDQTFYIFNSNIYISTDGGASWPTQGSFKSPGSVRKILITPTNYAYAAVLYGPVYKSKKPVVPPIAPTGLTIAGYDLNSVYLTFTDNSNNEDYFTIEQSINGIKYDSVANVTRQDYFQQLRVDYFSGNSAKTILQPSTTYYFRTRAAGAAGTSAYSNVVTFTTLAGNCVSTIPDNRSWTANSGGANVNNVRITATGGGSFVADNLNAGTCQTQNEGFDQGAVFSETCGVVYGYGDGGDAPNGNSTWNATTKVLTIKWQTGNYDAACSGVTTYTLNATDPAPGTIANLNGFAIKSNYGLLRWVPSSFEKQYVIERSTVSNFSTYIELARTPYPITQYEDHTIVAGTIYYYRVKAANGPLVGANYTTYSAYSPVTTIQAAVSPLFEPILNDVFKSYDGTGGGVWGDLDGDGLDDLFLPTTNDSLGNLIAPLAYINLGTGQFTKKIIPEMGVGNYRNANIADVDNDGRNDILLMESQSNAQLYFRNADGSYTKTSIVQPNKNFGGAGRDMSSWVDIDNDGDLDLFIPIDDITLTSWLYKNNGDRTFTQITAGELVTDVMSSLDAGWADFDNDGDMDVFRPGNGATGGHLYKNDGLGNFTKVLTSGFEAFRNAQRTVSWGDYDNDGFLDVFIGASTATLNRSALFKNNGNGTFTQTTTAIDFSTIGTVYGSGWGDIDNDGDIDLLITGGSVATTFSALFTNNGNGTFTKYAGSELWNSPGLSKLYGVPFYDADKDGFLDFYNGGFSSAGVPNIVYKNKTAKTASNNWVEVRLTGTKSNVSGVGARVKLIAGGKTQIREVQSHTGHASESSMVVHFGIGANTTVTSLSVDWPSTPGLQTLLNPAGINQVLAFSEDHLGPVAATFVPANNATAVSLTTTLSLTMNENVTGVAGKKIKIFKSSDLTTPVATIDGATGTAVGKTITFPIGAPLAEYTRYSVGADAGAFVDSYQNPSLAFDPAAWTFRSIDITKPTFVSLDHPATFAKGTGFDLFAVINDNSSTFSNPKLYYRAIGGSTFAPLCGIPNPVGSGNFKFTVAESTFDAMGLEYFAYAFDGDGNAARLPADTTRYYTYLSYGANDAIVPSSVIGLGGTVNDWKIFTIPFELGANNGVSNVFDELGTGINDKSAVRMLTYVDDKAWGEYPSAFSTFNRGSGYFINIAQDPGVIHVGVATAPSNNRANLFSLNLVQGWNQIGNPYLTNVSWADVATFNTSLTGASTKAKKFAAGSYTDADQVLKPYEGGFVFVDAPVTVSVPFLGQTPTSGRIETVSSDLGQDQWQLKFHLQNSELSNDLSGVGMRPTALVGKDQFDDLNPPRFINYLEANFPHAEFFAKNLSLDVVPRQDEYTWNFEIASNLNGATTLTWDNTGFGANSKEMYLFDVTFQKAIDMRENNSYTFEARGSNPFRIYFGSNLKNKIKPDDVTLGKAFPNPSSGLTTIPFTLPDQNTEFQVRLEVYDLMGQKVGTLMSGNYPAGYYSPEWNTSESSLASGVYLYKLSVSGSRGQAVLTEKIILRK